MKSFEKFSAQALTKKEMNNVQGGSSFTCGCGFDTTQASIQVTADSLQDALWGMGQLCDGAGANCTGN